MFSQLQDSALLHDESLVRLIRVKHSHKSSSRPTAGTTRDLIKVQEQQGGDCDDKELEEIDEEKKMKAMLNCHQDNVDSILNHSIEYDVYDTHLGRECNSSVSTYLEFGVGEIGECGQKKQVGMADQNA